MTDFDAGTVAARQVLLDALDALSAHRPALVVVGAQAVYLHVGTGDLAVAAYTYDGDLVLEPTVLDDDPLIEDVMAAAGFALVEHRDGTEPGTWATARQVGDRQIVVPVDLIVPEAFAPSGGRRSARLGAHDKMAVRRTHGLEAALVDHDTMTIMALDPADDRRIDIRVAGVAALLVGKLHKLHDRMAVGQRPDRLRDKDAADAYRLMQHSPAGPVAATLATLRNHDQAGPATVEAVDYLGELFAAARSPGVTMAVAALQGAIPEARVRAVATGWTRTVLASLR